MERIINELVLSGTRRFLELKRNWVHMFSGLSVKTGEYRENWGSKLKSSSSSQARQVILDSRRDYILHRAKNSVTGTLKPVISSTVVI